VYLRTLQFAFQIHLRRNKYVSNKLLTLTRFHCFGSNGNVAKILEILSVTHYYGMTHTRNAISIAWPATALTERSKRKCAEWSRWRIYRNSNISIF